jgi:hypothetical protein
MNYCIVQNKRVGSINGKNINSFEIVQENITQEEIDDVRKCFVVQKQLNELHEKPIYRKQFDNPTDYTIAVKELTQKKRLLDAQMCAIYETRSDLMQYVEEDGMDTSSSWRDDSEDVKEYYLIPMERLKDVFK